MEWPTLNGIVTATTNNGSTSVGATDASQVTLNALNTKSAYSVVAAGVPYVAHGIIVHLLANIASDTLIDLLTTSGSLGGLIISDLLASLSTSTGHYIFLPIVLPENTTIFARGQQTQGADQAIGISITFLEKGFMDRDEYTRITTYGANTADSGGTGVDPGAGGNTWSAWTEIVASTPYEMSAILVAIGDQGNTTMTAGDYLFQIGVGANGAEQIAFAGMFIANANEDQYFPCYIGPVDVHIPAGSRVTARVMSNITDATDRLVDFVLYGFD